MPLPAWPSALMTIARSRPVFEACQAYALTLPKVVDVPDARSRTINVVPIAVGGARVEVSDDDAEKAVEVLKLSGSEDQ